MAKKTPKNNKTKTKNKEIKGINRKWLKEQFSREIK